MLGRSGTGVAVATPGSLSRYPTPSGEWGQMNLGKKFAHVLIFLPDVKGGEATLLHTWCLFGTADP